MWKILVFAFIVLVVIILLFSLSRGGEDDKNKRNVKDKKQEVKRSLSNKPILPVTNIKSNPVTNIKSNPVTNIKSNPVSQNISQVKFQQVEQNKPISLTSNFSNLPIIDSILKERDLNNVIDLSKKE
jgi:hypothetical protein